MPTPTAKSRAVTLEGYQSLMTHAFEQVCDEVDWKAPIDCVVPHDIANIYMQAIEFMTALKPHAELITHEGKRMYRLTCFGYRQGPAGP
jgi:hypothetical protein